VNIKEYIKSGVLEAYWAGELNKEEMKEVDRLADMHPEIKHELEELRAALHSYADSLDMQPNSSVVESTLKGIEESEKKAFLHAVIQEDDKKEEEVVIKRVNVVPVWSIAATILLIVSASFNFIFFKEFRSAKKELAILEANFEEQTKEKSVLASLAKDRELELQYADLRIAHFLNKDNIHVRMDGLDLSPESFANVFWNVKSNAVFISVDNLPEPPHGHQYQLWAIKAGQAPIDAGIFDHNQLIQELKVIKGSVQAFAVTLEKEGGSPIASVEQTYVKGFLKKS
jgi:anti-sigma-K factor RskA